MNKLFTLTMAMAVFASLPSGAADRSAQPVFRPESRTATPPAFTRPSFQPRPEESHPATAGHPRPRNDRSLDLFIRGDDSRSIGPDRR